MCVCAFRANWGICTKLFIKLVFYITCQRLLLAWEKVEQIHSFESFSMQLQNTYFLYWTVALIPAVESTLSYVFYSQAPCTVQWGECDVSPSFPRHAKVQAGRVPLRPRGDVSTLCQRQQGWLIVYSVILDLLQSIPMRNTESHSHGAKMM